MDVIERFLQSEINTQELYEDIIAYIKSFHIRSGEFEGNEYIIKKMDRINFIIFPEYENKNGDREIHGTLSIYKDNLINAINEHAIKKGIVVKE